MFKDLGLFYFAVFLPCQGMCYGMFTQDLDLRWHVYDGMFMQLRAACVAHVAFEYEVPNSHSLILTI